MEDEQDIITFLWYILMFFIVAIAIAFIMTVVGYFAQHHRNRIVHPISNDSDNSTEIGSDNDEGTVNIINSQI